MKILFVCKSLPPKVAGGIQTHVWKLSGKMRDLGHDVSILSAGSLFRGEERAMRDGREIIEIPYLPGRRLPFLPELAEEWAFNRAAAAWLRRHASAFDIVHLQGRSGFTFAGQQRKTPLVATFHGFLSLEHRHGKKQRLAEKCHAAWAGGFEKNLLRSVDACIAVSPEMRDEMEELLPGVAAKTTVITNGVDVPKTLPRPDVTDPNLLLFVGRICELKGIYPLLETMRNLPERIRLVVVGDGEDRAEMMRRAEAAGLEERVQFVGSQPPERVFEWVHRARALVLPSYHETQGIVLLEANACGKPVAASDLPGTRSVVTLNENGLLFEAGNVTQMTAAIRAIFDDDELARRLGLRGRAIAAERFSWEKIALETERVYGRILAQKSQPRSASATAAAQRPASKPEALAQAS